MEEASIEKICNTYSVIIVDLDDTLTFGTSMEEFLEFHIQCLYGCIGILKIKFANVILKFLKALKIHRDTIVKVYTNFLLLGERFRDLQYSALLYLYAVIKERKIRIDLFKVLVKCRENGKTIILATSNIDLIANTISKFIGFHHVISSKILCNVMCKLEQRINGMEKMYRLIKLLRSIKPSSVQDIIYITDRWSAHAEKADMYLKNVYIV
jgi:phosphoserine phosphatase